MVKDRSLSSISLSFVVHIIVVIVMITAAYPILHVISMSMSDPDAILTGTVTFYPKGFQGIGYATIFRSQRIPNAFKNSLLYTSVGTAINLVMTILMAYPLSKKRLTLRNFYTILAVITMYFSGGLIPIFLVVKSLGMYNTLWALILPGSMSIFNMILMRSFFQSIPESLEESAHLEGASDMTVLLRIVLPLSKAMIATIGLFYAVAHWNSYLGPVIYLKTASKYPLQVILHQIVTANQYAQELEQMNKDEILLMMEGASINEAKSEMIKYATLVFSIVPMLVIYPFIQKYFVKGIMVGSFKG
ncbi:MAG: carbohydrate ABC transporter permease [Spirochaetales bacterium]|jgi:putative aldouronate transport system permease protein|nr:carbohydrate ABC transporter permease [Spirochaetales bacterium]